MLGYIWSPNTFQAWKTRLASKYNFLVQAVTYTVLKNNVIAGNIEGDFCLLHKHHVSSKVIFALKTAPN